MIKTTQLLHLVFNLPLHPRDIPRWRGAFIELDRREHSHFHNHQGDRKYHYRYPLIQYGVEEGRASIMAMGEGVAALEDALATFDWRLRWKNAPFRLEVERVNMQDFPLEMDELEFRHYELTAYVPFNDQNYIDWQHAPDLLSRVGQLNRLLVPHLLSFATGAEWRLPIRLEAKLMLLNHSYLVQLHDLMRPAFDLTFVTNLVLPEGIGLGRGVSMGFGRIRAIAPPSVLLSADRRTG